MKSEIRNWERNAGFLTGTPTEMSALRNAGFPTDPPTGMSALRNAGFPTDPPTEMSALRNAGFLTGDWPTGMSALRRRLQLNCGDFRLLILIFHLLLAAPGYTRDFHVATSGNDSNPGTRSKPFATFERARDAIRELPPAARKHAITVWIRGGDYIRTNSLELTRSIRAHRRPRLPGARAEANPRVYWVDARSPASNK